MSDIIEDAREFMAMQAEGVGTGAGEGATGQDTGTAWVTRSTDCPEAPAQARPLHSTSDHVFVEAAGYDPNDPQVAKHSEHTPACRLGDGDCICPNPYRREGRGDDE